MEDFRRGLMWQNFGRYIKTALAEALRMS